MCFDISWLPKHKMLCIDMKSFYASCECVDHGLDPLEDYVVVVSDKNRSGSVVLAASPKVKQDYGIQTGSRLYEVPRRRHIHIFNARMKRYLEISVQITQLFSAIWDQFGLPLTIFDILYRINLNNANGRVNPRT